MDAPKPIADAIWTGIGICLLVLICLVFILVLVDMFLERFSHEESTPTGATKVLYENELDITLEIQWTDVRNIDVLSKLINYSNEYRVTKDGIKVKVPDVAYTQYIEKSGHEISQWHRHLAKIRVNKVTLVEMETISTLQIGKRISKRLGRETYNKVVIEYEITNMDEVERGIAEDKQREQAKDQTKELLQQFVVPTKGDHQ